jgi:cytochrome c oxidase subunit II
VRRLLVFAVVSAFAALAAPAAFAQFTPVDPASPNAEGIRDSWLFVSIFVVAIFVLVEAALVVFIWRYRRQRRDRFEDGVQIHGSTRLELIWTFAPVVVLFAIAVFVLVELPGITDTPSAGARGDEQLEVQVTGRQFYWQYEYPNGVIAIDRMRAPEGVPVHLEVTAGEDDVIHSWWIPALGGKIDAIPGTVNTTWFEATRTGVFSGQCAELCGVEHAKMLAEVEVLPAAEFVAWLEQRRRDQTAVTSELGEELWAGVCAKCHGPDGEGGIGPRIAGSVVLEDAEAIENIVRNGRREMPAVGSGWSTEQMNALTTYLQENPPSGG